MSTDLTFWETSVPIVSSLYRIFVAIGWGLLIGNCAFQSLKAMFAGLGFETESPAILLFRTALFGTLLIFSNDICDIGLSIGKNIMDLIGIPSSITITMPDETMFSGIGASWLLVIIIGFVLGFQIIRLFFEIAERYVVVAILTLLCPIGLSMGGSKSTKDICTGFMRTYASMITMMVMNVLFLKLLLSALSTMPKNIMILPWCLLVVGIAKTARKADSLISKIGLNPAITGDPLGYGRGTMAAVMAARTIMNSASKVGNNKSSGRTVSGNSKAYNNNKNITGGTNVNGANIQNGNVSSNNAEQSSSSATASSNNAQNIQNSQTSRFGASNNTVNAQKTSSSRFGSNSFEKQKNGNVKFGSSGRPQVNTNRFGAKDNGALHKENGLSTVNAVGGEKVSNKHTETKFASSAKGSSKSSEFKEANNHIGKNPQSSVRFGAKPSNSAPISGIHKNTNLLNKSGVQLPFGGVRTNSSVAQSEGVTIMKFMMLILMFTNIALRQ